MLRSAAEGPLCAGIADRFGMACGKLAPSPGARLRDGVFFLFLSFFCWSGLSTHFLKGVSQ
jgi:hypothetical protein